jgi:hypothetical protein
VVALAAVVPLRHVAVAEGEDARVEVGLLDQVERGGDGGGGARRQVPMLFGRRLRRRQACISASRCSGRSRAVLLIITRQVGPDCAAGIAFRAPAVS